MMPPAQAGTEPSRSPYHGPPPPPLPRPHLLLLSQLPCSRRCLPHLVLALVPLWLPPLAFQLLRSRQGTHTVTTTARRDHPRLHTDRPVAEPPTGRERHVPLSATGLWPDGCSSCREKRCVEQKRTMRVCTFDIHRKLCKSIYHLERH